MLSLVVGRFVQALLASPEPILSPGRLGAKRPSSPSDLPSVAVSLTIDDSRGSGLGRFVRAGDSVIQHVAVVEVKPSADGFSDDLTSLRLTPLPLKKDPSSRAREFRGDDVKIRNVTGPTAVDYAMVGDPARKEEYKLEVPAARVVFGAAQTPGEKLEITHWTVAWRDEILGDRYRGLMILEVWAGTFAEAHDLSQKLQGKLRNEPGVFRLNGFPYLRPAGLDPIADARHEPASGSAFVTWRQTLRYRFAFEAEEGGELAAGTTIRRIDVDMDEQVDESMRVPQSTQ